MSDWSDEVESWLAKKYTDPVRRSSCSQRLSYCAPVMTLISVVVSAPVLLRSRSASSSCGWGSETGFLDRVSGAHTLEPCSCEVVSHDLGLESLKAWVFAFVESMVV